MSAKKEKKPRKVAFESKKKPGPRKGLKKTKPKPVAFKGKKPAKRSPPKPKPVPTPRSRKPSWRRRGTCACCGKERVLGFMNRYCSPCAINGGKMCPKCRISVGGKIDFDKGTGMYICKNCQHAWPAKPVKCVQRRRRS